MEWAKWPENVLLKLGAHQFNVIMRKAAAVATTATARSRKGWPIHDTWIHVKHPAEHGPVLLECLRVWAVLLCEWRNDTIKIKNKNKSSVFFAWPIKRTERTFRVHPRRKPTVMSLSLYLFLLLLLFQAMNSDRKCRKKKSNYKWCEDKTANTKLGITLRQSHTRIHTIYLCVAHQAENTEKLNSSNCQHAVRMWLARYCIALHCNECSANKKKIIEEVEDSRWGRTKEEKQQQHQQQQQTTKT